MKKKLLVCLAVAGLVLFGVIGCNQPGGGGGSATGFIGTWQLSGGGLTETVTFTATTMSVVDTGFLNGTMDCSITSASSNHIGLSTTAVSGDYTGIPYGYPWYMTYTVSGNTMYLSLSYTAYPATAAAGPYYKQ